ncbi:MAG: guanylate kinase [Opitutales bacterium]|nr:guanylate kinase [Opitutales bacterium]NRA27796.1 guanylate kinase [Opitutales bacterium]
MNKSLVLEKTVSTSSQAILLIISGPTASGKTTLCDRMLETYQPAIQRVITSTTRAVRPGEINKRDYYFFTQEEFIRREQAGEFYETADVHGRRYGTLKSEIQSKLSQGIDCLLNIDVQGAMAFFEAEAQDPLLSGRIHSVFIIPPDLDTLRNRLRERGESDPSEIERRLKSAEMEMSYAHHYAFQLKTTSRDADFSALQAYYNQIARPS